MLNIGICDDQEEARFTLRCLLERVLERRGIDNQMIDFSAGIKLLRWFDTHAGELDMLFLDIEMAGLDGMETAKALRAFDANLQIVFVTGHPDFVFAGYSVGALDYLLKPPAEERIEKIITRGIAALHLASGEDFSIKNTEGIYRIPKTSILYFYSEKRQVICVTNTRKYAFYDRLGEVEKKVGPPFIRIHQRFLVNAEAVEHMDKDSVQLRGLTLPISRSYRKEAMLALARIVLR